MASIAMLVSEIAHSLKQPNNKSLRENIKLLIVHTRNELIRRSFENHGYVDRGLVQRFKVNLTDVYDGEIELPEGMEDIDVALIKRSCQKVPKPVRLTNNLPFDRVSSVGYRTSREFPFIKETSARFRNSVPGLCGMPCYDYINGYIYIFPADNKAFELEKIIIESAFERPTEIQIANNEIDSMDTLMEENEFLLSEDMIGQIKDIIYKRDLLNTVRETNEIPDTIKYN
nr:MAG TPA: Structural protein [Crassvirales sp.]